jgi:hypothetical protein
MLDMFRNPRTELINQYGANNVYGSGFNNYQPNGGSLMGTSDY